MFESDIDPFEAIPDDDVLQEDIADFVENSLVSFMITAIYLSLITLFTIVMLYSYCIVLVL